MTKPKRIPIARAKELAEKYGYDGVIIIGVAPNPGYTCATSYGNTEKMCDKMKRFGERLQPEFVWGNLGLPIRRMP